MRGIAAALVLIALGWGGVAEAATPQCTAGDALVTSGQLEAAKQRYNKALDDEGPAGRECGLAGLMTVAQKEKEAAAAEEDNANKQTLDEAVDDVRNFITQNRIWIFLVLGVWGLFLLVYLFRTEKRVRVRAPASSADLATAVVASANAAGGSHSSAAKIYNATDETESTTAADLAKVFRLPGTVPLADLLKRPPFSGWLSIRLDLSGSIAGGWAVIDLTYREPLARKRHERIALDLGDIEDDEKAAVLALVGGAWLNALLQTEDPAPVRDRDANGVLAHALFRAGANRQTLGKTHIARACYGTMPEVESHVAPFAWAGARLNEMMALKTERRWLEAAQEANEIGDFPKGVIGSADARHFGEEQVAELLLRQRYMTAILRVDHWYAVKKEPTTFSADPDELQAIARTAVNRLTELVGTEPGGGGKLESLHAAGRMVALSFKIAAEEGGSIEDVRAQLGVGEADDDRAQVSAAGYYDAACAVSLLLEQLEVGNDDRDERAREGVWLLETAVTATPEGRRPRVVAMAKADPMLDHLEKADPAGFAKALGEDPPADEPQKESAVPFYFAGNGARSRSATSTS